MSITEDGSLPNQKKRQVLVCALDWGLGHATRCIPLIESLVQEGHEPILASSGSALDFWKAYFPKLETYPLANHRMVYIGPAWLSGLILTPQLLFARSRDKELVKRICLGRKIDLILSDNRYGCFDKNTPSIFLTHQLDLLPPTKWNAVGKWLWKHSWKLGFGWMIKPFQEVWIPDLPDKSRSLAGKMALSTLPVKQRHIGYISRLSRLAYPNKKGTLLLLSGPEPQRTLLENKLLASENEFIHPVTLVRGSAAPGKRDIPAHWKVYNQLTDASFINELIASHQLVVCRPGYSTLMDLHAVGAKFVVVPTPGQPEQEYLAERLHAFNIAPFQSQKKLNVVTLLQTSERYKGFEGSNAANFNALWSEVLSSLAT